jgi:hypothetical protein
MRTHSRFTAVQAISALSVGVIFFAAAWLVAVPTVVTPLTFAALAGLLAAVLWVAKVTYQNGQSTGSVGQLLYETEQAARSNERADNSR